MLASGRPACWAATDNTRPRIDISVAWFVRAFALSTIRHHLCAVECVMILGVAVRRLDWRDADEVNVAE